MGAQKFTLKRNHTWKSKPGNCICVLERGLVRFEYPRHWVVKPGDGAIHLHDREPSVESCDLGISLFPIPPAEEAPFSLDDTLRASLSKDRDAHYESEIHRATTPMMELVWIEQRYTDKEYKRDARLRVAIVRGPVLLLITMNYWDNRASGMERVWDEVFRTLMFGDQVADPTAGPVLQ